MPLQRSARRLRPAVFGFVLAASAAFAAGAGVAAAPPRIGNVGTTDPVELAGTLRMFGAHAPLRTPAAGDPDSVANRLIFERMLFKALGDRPTAVATATPEPPRTGLVGTLEGRFSIDSHGAANYSVTLPLPDSRGYFQPALALAYDCPRPEHSRARRGGALQGTRPPRPLLSGWQTAPLRQRSGYPGPSRRGLPHRGRLVRHRHRRGRGPGDRSLRPGRVQRPQIHLRQTRRRRRRLPARFRRSPAGPRLRRLPLRVEDQLGDYVEFHYEHAGFGEWNVAAIDYAGGRDQPAPFRIRFLYSTRAPRVPRYESGRRVDRTRRLDAIEIVHRSSGAVVSRFDFAFVPAIAGAEQRLQSVTGSFAADVGAPLESLPPTIFTWEEQAAAAAPFVQLPPGAAPPAAAALGDFDGDGKTDYVEARDGLIVHLSTAAGINPAGQRWLAESPLAAATGAPATRRIRCGDFNGDGRSDLLVVSASGQAFAAISTGRSFSPLAPVELHSALADPAASAGPATFRHLRREGATWDARLTLADFTGDGRDDLLIHGYDGALHLFFSNGDALLPSPRGPARGGPPANFGEEALFAPAGDDRDSPGDAGSLLQTFATDLNGDGLADYVWLETHRTPFGPGEPSGYSIRRVLKCALFLPDGHFAAPSTLFTGAGGPWSEAAAVPYLGSCFSVLPGDFNGDDLPDFLILGEDEAHANGGATLLLSRGTPTLSVGETAAAFSRIDRVLPPAWTQEGSPLPLRIHSVAPDEWRELWAGAAGGRQRDSAIAKLRALERADSGAALVLDVDDDRLDDLVWSTGDERTGPERQWWVCHSRGDGSFSAPARLTGQPWASLAAGGGTSNSTGAWEQVRRSPDFDGDGMADWIRLRGRDAATAAIVATARGRGAADGQPRIGGLVAAFTDGYGSTVRAGYRSARDESLYTAGPPVAYPIRDWRPAFSVVIDKWDDVGADVAAQFSYRYSGHHLDLSGRGGMGFGAFITLDRQTGFMKYQFLARSFPMTGLTVRDQTYWYWPVGDKIALKLISTKDHAVVFDAVIEPLSRRLFGTLYPFVSATTESRAANDTKADHVLPLPALAAGAEQPALGGKPVSAVASRTTTRFWHDRQHVDAPPPIRLPEAGVPYSPTVGSCLAPAQPVSAPALAVAASALPAAITSGNLTVTESQPSRGEWTRTVNTYRPPQGPDDPFTDLVETTTAFKGDGTSWHPGGTQKSFTYVPHRAWLESEITDTRHPDDDSPPQVTTTRFKRDARGRLQARDVWVEDFSQDEPATSQQQDYAAAGFDDATDRPAEETTPKWQRTGLRYHPLFRQLSAAHYNNGVNATFRYDGLGRSILVSNDAGYRSETRRAWTHAGDPDWQRQQQTRPPPDSGGLPGLSVYAEQAAETDEPTVTTYYDRVSRKIRVVTVASPGAVPSIVDSVFDREDHLVATSEPYAPVDEQVSWTLKTYDGYGVVTAETRTEAPGPAAAPATVSEFLRRGERREERGEREPALADFAAAVRLDPADVRGVYGRARVLHRLHRYAEAVADYTRALELQPSLTSGLLARGLCQRRAGDFPAARADFDRAIQLEPGNADALDYRSDLFVEQKNYPAALADLDAALRLDPERATFWVDRGYLRLRLRHYVEAIADFDRAVALEEKNDAAYYHRAQARVGQGDLDAALRDFTKAIELAPKDYTNFRARAVAYDLAGDFPAAIADYEQAARLADEEAAYLHFWLHLERRRLGRPAPTAALTRVAAETKQPWTKAVAQFLEGTLSEPAFFAAARSGAGEDEPHSHECEAFYYAGMVRLVRGDHAGARLRFEKCVATKVVGFYEMRFAEAELRRLEGNPPAGSRRKR